ncbi:MAG: hypothetical protein ABW032_04445, partial [Burkholderiaceae bacterium]
MLWVGVHLPALSLESFIATLGLGMVDDAAGRQGAAMAAGPSDPDPVDPVGPVALIDRQRLVAVNGAAREGGLRPGQKRATALGLVPHARLGEADAARDAAALQAVVHALMAFTPAVSVAGRHVVLAEVQASLRCFGGLARLLERLRAGLASLGHRVRIACGPTPKAAEWLATWRADFPPPDTKAGWRAGLGALPVSVMAAAAP